MNLREILAYNLKEIRKKNSFSQKGMAEFIGISAKLYNELENTTANATLNTIEKIAQSFSIQPETLFVPENTQLLNINSHNENGDTRNGIFQNDGSLSKVIDKLIAHNQEIIKTILESKK
jgi:DNA-binding XRE family transcriptional regulator